MFEIQFKKIKDFGLSRKIEAREEEDQEEGSGVYLQVAAKGMPVPWCAPETIAHNKSTMKSDVWMLGKNKKPITKKKKQKKIVCFLW